MKISNNVSGKLLIAAFTVVVAMAGSCRLGAMEQASQKIDRCVWAAKDSIGDTEFDNLCIRSELQSIKAVLLAADSRIIKLLKIQNASGQTALHIVVVMIVYRNNYEGKPILNAIFKALSDYVDFAQDQDCDKRRQEVFELFTIMDRNGRTAFRIAERQSQKEIADMLKVQSKMYHPRSKKKTG